MFAPSSKLAHEMTVVESALAERPFAHGMFRKERLDRGKQVAHGGPDMWEISPGQYGIFRQCRNSGRSCDISHMGSKPDIAAIRDAITREMEAKGFSKRSLSIKAGLSQTAVRDVLERTDNPGIGTLHKIADALSMTMEAMSGGGAVELAGQIGAGGLIAYHHEDAEKTFVPRPPAILGRIMALAVSGESMLPKYEAGDIVYIRRDHDGLLKDYIGRYCAVHLTDGGTYLKLLTVGTDKGRYTLRSLNAADMENVEVVWASPVLFVMPSFARAMIDPAKG